MMGLLTKYQKEMNCLMKNDIPGAVRELYNNQERIEKAFARREKELTYGGQRKRIELWRRFSRTNKKSKTKIKITKRSSITSRFYDR